MKFLKTCLLVALAWLFQSCFDSDEHIFNGEETVEITVDASLARSMSVLIPSVKADTFTTSDTIFFLTTITPNKIIRVQDYHWLMDGVYCSSEYNFKKQITEPGYHKFTFVLKDHFGDMHYDSLEVWIADPPTLNDSAYVPASGTQAIDPYEAIYFAWSATTKGIQLKHYYHFTLYEQIFANSESDFTPVDTILTEPHYTFHNELNSFKKYDWTVEVYNDYGFTSEQKIESSFFTKGLPGEGSLQTTLSTSQDVAIPALITLQDLSNPDKTLKYNYTLSRIDNKISLGSIPAGKYQLRISSSLTDFKTIEKEVVINDGYITMLDNITLTDSIKPRIASVSGLDSLPFADSLQFVIKDAGGVMYSQNISVYLESDLITDKIFKDSILTVHLNKNEQSWAYRILTITATDGSKNTETKSFYILPTTVWFTTNSDTTIASDESITFFINDHNSFGFKVDSLIFFNVTKNERIVSVPNTGTNSFTANLEASLFDEFQTIRSTVLYKNGLSQSKDWNLSITKARAKEDE